jgi:hypothetical protein
MHRKDMSYSYLARTITDRLRDALALTEEHGNFSVELIFKKHLSAGFNEEPDIK